MDNNNLSGDRIFNERATSCHDMAQFGTLGSGHYLCGGGGGVGGKKMGWARLIFFREKGWAKREFHDDWGWVIVCFVKNHTHYNSCGRSK